MMRARYDGISATEPKTTRRRSWKRGLESAAYIRACREGGHAVSVFVIGVAECATEQYHAPRAAIERGALKACAEQLRAPVVARMHLVIDRLEPAAQIAHA